MEANDPRHGTEAGYEQHRRDGETPCDACYEGDLKAARRRSKRKAMGHKYQVEVPQTVLDRLAEINGQGFSDEVIADWVGLSASQVWRVRTGASGIVYTRTLEALSDLRVPADAVTLVGVTRRIQALQVLGYSCKRIAEAAGVDETTVIVASNRTRDHMARRTQAAIVDAYRRLHMTPMVPVTANDKRGVSRAKREAALKGKLPALAWDNIDDPTELPTLADPVDIRTGPGRPLLATDGFFEDLEFLLDTGETFDRILERLSVTFDALERRCYRADRADLLGRFNARRTQRAADAA